MELTRENYFSQEAQMAYMGSSQFKDFLSCEAAALAKIQGRYKPPASRSMLVGSYVDAWYSGELPDFTERHPDMFKKDRTLKADFLAANAIIDRMQADQLYSLLMSGEKQVIRTGKIAGVPFKIKIDSLLDAAACRQIAEEFPGAAPALGFGDGAIVDQKVMRDLGDVWSDEERRMVPFAQAWGYDIQGAIYQAVEGHMMPFILAWGYDIQGAIYQAVEGHMMPFILAVGTREEPADLAALYIPDDALRAKLYEVEDLAPRFQAIKEGREEPRRCERCPWCRATRTLRTIVDFRELGRQ